MSDNPIHVDSPLQMDDGDDVYELDVLEAYALERAFDYAAEFENGGDNIAAAHAYAAIALAAGQRLQRLGGIPEEPQ